MKIVKGTGFIIIFYAISLLIIMGFNIGALLTFLLGLSLINYKHIYKIKIIHYLFLTGISIFLLISSSLFIFGHYNTTTYKEDAVIVLGCGLAKNEEDVSKQLELRLLGAIQYIEQNENAIIVVSGGQGPNELIPEALAMQRYLISKGIAEDKIIMEDKSSSTYENFKFSKEILDEYFEQEYKVAFVTSEYHIFRASRISEKLGLSTSHYYANTPIVVFIPSYIRELLAIVKYIIF